MIGTYVTLLNGKDPFREKKENTLIYDYTHELDFISWFFGKIKDVVAKKTTLGSLKLQAKPNMVQMILSMASGALVQVHMDYIQHPQRRIFEIYGDKGTLSYDFMSGEIRYFTFGKDHNWQSLDVIPLMERSDDLFRSEHAVVLTSYVWRAKSIIYGEESLVSFRMAQMAIDAASINELSVKAGVVGIN